MTVAHTVRMYLEQHEVPFEVVPHPHTLNSLRTAAQAHVPPECVAKGVLFEDDLEHAHYLMAVVPASHRVEAGRLALQIGRNVHLATEEDAAGLFPDCEAGAIPPLGPAYGVETIWESSLMRRAEVYLEGGDHASLVRVTSADLAKLMTDCWIGPISSER